QVLDPGLKVSHKPIRPASTRIDLVQNCVMPFVARLPIERFLGSLVVLQGVLDLVLSKEAPGEALIRPCPLVRCGLSRSGRSSEVLDSVVRLAAQRERLPKKIELVRGKCQ